MSTLRDRELFRPLPDDAVALLAGHAERLKKVFPLKPKHARLLPQAVADLSRSLTSARDREFRPDYMNEPRELGAYLHYFLPWNLMRLARLVRGLDLGLADGATIQDMGAGPLTFAQALWIGRPDLRELRLDFTCRDLARKPMQHGVGLFRELAGEDSPWRFRLESAHLTAKPYGQSDLVVAANVINETDSVRLEAAASSLGRRVREGGRLLLVEPGVRAGGRLVSDFREQLLETGEFVMDAPCPHDVECPMSGEGPRWCHFNFSPAGAPDWLEKLSRQAGFPKTNLSLSFLLARKVGADESAERRETIRIISEAFDFQDGLAQYACSARGLTLVAGMERGFWPGALLAAQWPGSEEDEAERDPKTGALVYRYDDPRSRAD